MNKTGLIHVYTGEGKGKTTAAVGLAIRAFGHGFTVVYASFHKDPDKYGYNEINVLRKLGIKVFNFARYHKLCNVAGPAEESVMNVVEGLAFLKKYINDNYVELLILDEINISVRDGYLDEDVLIDFLKSKPSYTEVVCTGRGAGKRLINIADYVSVVEKVKHPFDKKIYAREGIEY